MNQAIIHGDCLEQLSTISTNTIDMVLTDPPFNIRKKYRSYNDNRKFKDYIEWCHVWLGECIRVMKDGAALYLFNYPENNALLFPFLNEKLTFKRWMTWHYPCNTGMSPTNFTRSQHSILFYIKGTAPICFNKSDISVPYLNPTDKRIKLLMEKGSKGKVPFDVFHFNIVKNVSKDKTDHPCQIPVPLLEIFIKASTRPGDTVLDPFAGSFSTAAACQKNNRNSINIEMDAVYCEIGRRRLKLTSSDTSI